MISQILHTILVFSLGSLFPAVCVFGGMKLISWAWGATSVNTMAIGVVIGLGVYSVILFPFIKWAKQLDKILL